MKITGFHASSGKIRYVTLGGTRAKPVLVDHGERPLQLNDNRTAFAQAARNLFVGIIADQSTEAVAYVLSMDAKTRDQVAGLILPFGVLSVVALDKGLPADEYIAANFSKKPIQPYVASFSDKYDAADQLFGIPAKKWSNQHRLAALASWMSHK